MNQKLKTIKNIVSENCVTLILNTHRTKPDNQKDPLALKNSIKEVQERLATSIDKRIVERIMTQLQNVEKSIDHSHNLESLIVFANENMSDFVRLPITVTERVVIDTSFATRDLIRAMHFEFNYYVLVLSQNEVRLIEAFNDKVVEEVKGLFPIENTWLKTKSSAESANASRQRNLIAEFFNRVDKEVNAVRKNNPLKVFICADENNYHDYVNVADEKNTIYPIFLNRNRLDDKAHAIVNEAWKLLQSYKTDLNNARKTELKAAVSNGKFMSDINDIWNAIHQGRVETLFIEEHLFQKAKWVDHVIHPIADNSNEPDSVDDIYDEMIAKNMAFGGEVVFLPENELSKFNGFGAGLRY